MIQATCPHCAFQGGVEAFFSNADGKRLAAVTAELPPECGRAVIAYLGLFKPLKTGLRMARAIKLASEVAALIKAGSVCKDERSGVRRPASPAMWAQGIETMLAQRDALTLPLESHGYLRSVVFGVADKADAATERQREADAQAGKHLKAESGKSEPVRESRLDNELNYIAQQVGLGFLKPEEATIKRAEAHEKYGAK